MKKSALFLFLILSVAFLFSCQKQNEYYDSEYFTMDATLQVRLSTDGMINNDLRDISSKVNEKVRNIEAVISKTDEDSDVARFNMSGDNITSPDIILTDILDKAAQIYNFTDGAYDIVLGNLIDLWNVTGGGPKPTDEEIAEAKLRSGFDKITFNANEIAKSDEKIKLDLGGIGKGYAIDKAVEYLKTTDVKYGLCSFGSTVCVFGTKKDGERFLVTVCNPQNVSENIAKIRISEGAISTSGDYERYFEENGKRYHHILNPETGYPTDNGIHSVTVFAKDATTADALSTALLVCGIDKTAELYESKKIIFEAMIVTDSEIYLTDGFKSGNILEITDNENYTVK